jgi:hypothetical protein
MTADRRSALILCKPMSVSGAPFPHFSSKAVTSTNMKTTQTLGCAMTLVTVLLAGLIADSAQAQAVTATFTNTFGDAIWERDAHIANLGNPGDVSTPGNWDTGAYPNDHHKIQDPNTGVFIPNSDPL